MAGFKIHYPRLNSNTYHWPLYLGESILKKNEWDKQVTVQTFGPAVEHVCSKCLPSPFVEESLIPAGSITKQIIYFTPILFHEKNLPLFRVVVGGNCQLTHYPPTLSPRRQKKMTRAIAVWTLAAPLRRPTAASPTSSPADFSTWDDIGGGNWVDEGKWWLVAKTQPIHPTNKKSLLIVSRVDESCKNWVPLGDKTIDAKLIEEFPAGV